MLSFASDYTEGAHPKLLERLAERNLVPLQGYGADPDTEAAKRKICAACGRDDLQIQFLTGGTQTNLIAISCLLRSYEAVVCAASGHISVHEAGAIEYSGHKVIALPHGEGKLAAGTLAQYMETFLGDETNEHMARPGMVYISQPTEFGTLYSKAELTALHDTCVKYGLPLYIDGARLGYGLMSPACDLTLRELTELCELFYIGGTKVGALCGMLPWSSHGATCRSTSCRSSSSRAPCLPRCAWSASSSTPSSPTACTGRSAAMRWSLPCG